MQGLGTECFRDVEALIQMTAAKGCYKTQERDNRQLLSRKVVAGLDATIAPQKLGTYCCLWGQRPRGGRVFSTFVALWQYTCLTLLPTVRWRYRRHVAQLCCWRLATLTGRGDGGGGGGMITFLSTVRWRYRRHVAQLCCWRLATLTGRGAGGVGGDDNVPFDCKMTLPKTRCPTLLLTSCYLDREGGWGGWGGDDNVPSTVRWRYRRHVAQLCCWRLATLTGGVGGWGGDDNVPFDCKMTLPKTRCPTLLGSFTTYIYQNACFLYTLYVYMFIYIYIYVCKGYLKYLCIHVSSRCCGIAKVFFGILTSCSKRQNIIDHKHKILQITV